MRFTSHPHTPLTTHVPPPHTHICSEIGKSIAEAEQQIAQYREEIQQSREIRKHRQEYDALAQVGRQRMKRNTVSWLDLLDSYPLGRLSFHPIRSLSLVPSLSQCAKELNISHKNVVNFQHPLTLAYCKQQVAGQGLRLNLCLFLPVFRLFNSIHRDRSQKKR